MKLWQINYPSGCYGEIVEKQIGYKWNIYIPSVDEPIESGWRLRFVDAITMCKNLNAKLENARIGAWELVL